jgi:translation initiation factor IF-2
LPPIVTQRVLGEAEIAKIFEITVKGRQQKSIAGCKIRNGTIGRLHKVRVLRDGEKIFDGKLPQLAVFACQDEN